MLVPSMARSERLSIQILGLVTRKRELLCCLFFYFSLCLYFSVDLPFTLSICLVIFLSLSPSLFFLTSLSRNSFHSPPPPLLPSSATQNSLDNLRTFILSLPLPSSSTQNSLDNLRTFILSLSTCMLISISLLSVSCFSPLLFTMSVSISFSISLLFFLLLCLLSSSVQICIHFFSSSSLSSLSFLLSSYFSLPFSSSLIISQSVYLSRVLLPLSPPYLFFFSTSLFPPL